MAYNALSLKWPHRNEKVSALSKQTTSSSGNKLSEEDYYWSDLVNEALEDSSLTKQVKGQIMKNGPSGGFAEICKGVL